MSNYNRIETENALLDEIIYNCKIIMTSLIVKDETKANRFETKKSITDFDIYRAIKEGRASLYYFSNITPDDVNAAIPGLRPGQVNQFLNNYNRMSPAQKAALLNYLSEKFIAEYEEPNDYYRLISGLPPSDQPDIYLTKEDILNILIPIDITKPIHKLSDIEISTLKTAGILDKLKERHPEATYLNYIDKGITFYNARLAPKYSILYITENCEESILNKFQELYLVNMDYICHTMDENVFKYYSELYERFMMMNITINTVADMIGNFAEFFINRDIFDIRTAQYFFEAYGIQFFPELPMKYQKKLVRSLNKLIKYKGTKKNILDIVEIFGFDNIDIYKYYLNKYHTQTHNQYNQYVIGDNGDTYTFLGYLNEVNSLNNYELQFIRVPLEETVNNYLKDETNIFNYDDFIRSNDPYWNGDRKHDDVKDDILSKEFNTVITQYMSVSTSYSISKISMEITYFINMLLYYGIDPSAMTLSIPGIDSRDSSFNIFDTFVYIYALMYLYIDLDPAAETIMTDPEKLAFIHGFDLTVDLDKLLSDIEEIIRPLLVAEQECAVIEDDTYIPYTVESIKSSLGITSDILYGPYAQMYISILSNIFTGNGKFVTLNRSVAPSMKQMVNAYNKNKAIHDFIEAKMITAQDVNELYIYRRLYNTLMIVTLNNDLFKIHKKGNKELSTAKSYIEYIQYSNPRMNGVINSILKLRGTEEYKTRIYDEINKVCSLVMEFIDSDQLLNIFVDLPLDTVDYIKTYMTQIIKFFMSFKITLIDSQSINKLDPEANRLYDHSYLVSNYTMLESRRFTDNIAMTAQFAMRDLNRLEDNVIVNEYYENEEE